MGINQTDTIIIIKVEVIIIIITIITTMIIITTIVLKGVTQFVIKTIIPLEMMQ